VISHTISFSSTQLPLVNQAQCPLQQRNYYHGSQVLNHQITDKIPHEQTNSEEHNIHLVKTGLSNGVIISENHDTSYPVDPLRHSESFLSQLNDPSPTVNSSLSCEQNTLQENGVIHSNLELEKSHVHVNRELINPVTVTDSVTLVNGPIKVNPSNTQHIDNTSENGSNSCAQKPVSPDRGRSRNMRAMSRSERRLHSASPYRKRSVEKTRNSDRFSPVAINRLLYGEEDQSSINNTGQTINSTDK
jgi:hypothetical protein